MSSELPERENVAVILGENNIVLIPWGDALVEFFRLDAMNEDQRTDDDKRIHAALVLTLGTVQATSNGAERLREALTK